jgi:osmotically-inducible protein OsmY
MKNTLRYLGLISVALVTLGIAHAQSGDAGVKPDNTKINQRDQNPTEVTAGSQKMNADDRALTAKIRRAVVKDKTLSTYAHNVKIVSQNGVVTLKGPVHSDTEVTNLMRKATDAAGGSEKVVNELSVKQ